MKNYTSTYLFILILFFTESTSLCQSAKDALFIEPSSKKQILTEIKRGNSYYGNPKQHWLAILHYLKAIDYFPDDAELNMKTGHCLLTLNRLAQATLRLEKAKQLYGNNLPPTIHRHLASLYHLSMRWSEAIGEYNECKKLWNKKDKEEILSLEKKIEECIAGRELTKDTFLITIENLDDAINSPFPEYGPVISADESVLMFTSRRDSSTGGRIDPLIGQYYDDVYSSTFENGRWSKAVNIGAPVNTSGHDGVIGLSNDGQRMFIYKGELGDGNIYITTLKGKQWSEPEKLPKTINTPYPFLESSVSFSPDERTIYFTSDKEDDNLGGRDIFMSKLDKDGNWGKAANIGPVINTKYDEEGVFLHADGKTLFFSSKGHKTMGGYDIFKTVFNEITGQWTVPVNIGYPINTPWDDVFFVLSASGKHAYYSSKNASGHGEHDIYKIIFLEVKDISSVKDVIEHEVVITEHELDELKIALEKSVDIVTLMLLDELSDEAKVAQIAALEEQVKQKEEQVKALHETISSLDNRIDSLEKYVKKSSGQSSLNKSISDIRSVQSDLDTKVDSLISLDNKDRIYQNDFTSLTSSIQEASSRALPVKAQNLPELISNVVIMKGIIYTDTTSSEPPLPIEASIELIDNQKNSVVANFKSNSATGKYLVSLPYGKNYGIAVNAPGYLFHSENFDISVTGEYKEVVKNIHLKKIKAGSAVVLKNIFFEFNQSKLTAESQSELGRLFKLLNEYPKMKIEVSGHTDNIGSDEYNSFLSEKRAEEVKKYLWGLGIDGSRMTAKGYSSKQPIATNESDEGRKMNRRTEFMILNTE